jgi:endonuclease/exonuclease/phosphatase family metal-dependent hydrolase
MLQVATFNIGGARKLRGTNFLDHLVQDVESVLRQVIDFDQPFVLGLQETGQYLPLNREYIHVEQELAEALGATLIAFTPEVTSRDHPHPRLWERPFYAGMRFAAEGNSVLTNLEMAAWDWGKPAAGYPGGEVNAAKWQFCRATQISHAALYSTGSRDTQPRNAMVASLQHPEYGALFLINTHLGAISGEDRHDSQHPRTQVGTLRRQHEALEIRRLVDELRQAEVLHNHPPRPIILVGDFNAVPGSPPLDELQEVFTLLPITHPKSEQWSHSDHRILIDHVMVNDPRQVLPESNVIIQTNVPDDLTDHLPVVATFR